MAHAGTPQEEVKKQKQRQKNEAYRRELEAQIRGNAQQLPDPYFHMTDTERMVRTPTPAALPVPGRSRSHRHHAPARVRRPPQYNYDKLTKAKQTYSARMSQRSSRRGSSRR